MKNCNFFTRRKNIVFLLAIGIFVFYGDSYAQTYRDRDGDGLIEKTTKPPKDTSFHETIKPVNDINGDGISDYIYTHINGKGIPESTIIGRKTNGNSTFGWEIGRIESVLIFIGSLVSIIASLLTALWFFYDRLDKKIVSVRTELRTEMKEEVKATEERLNKRMDESEERLNKRMDKAEQDIKEVREEVKEVKKEVNEIKNILSEIKGMLSADREYKELVKQILSNNNQNNQQINNK